MSEQTAGFDREVRLGLVLYGGVSLAIYINGVTHEFYRAVRGLGVYSLLKELIGAEIIVDIISGTSAGGINGIMLAYALANEKDFGQFAGLWRQHGDIDRLMRDPDVNGDETRSLLDGEGYYQEKLERAFLDLINGKDAPAGAHVSPTAELDLFITATDIDGNLFTTFDDSGHEIDVKEHRTVFQLKHRAGRKEPFNPNFRPGGQRAQPDETIRALATLARATSAFPGAFPPVHAANAEEGDETADAKLQLWGKLKKEAWFVDGGVLDNKPFTHTLNAIFRRLSNKVVDRRLFYVEPDPERFSRALAAREPDFFEVIVKSVAGIPSYESIAADLNLLREHNRKVERYTRLSREVAAGNYPAGNQEVYDRARLVALSERIVQGVLREEGRSQELEGERLQAAKELVSGFDAETRGVKSADIDAYDVYLRLRQAFHLSYVAADALERPSPDERIRTALIAINGAIQTLEILQHWMEHVVDTADFHWQERSAQQIWKDVRNAYAELLDSQGLTICTCSEAERRALHQQLAARASVLIEWIGKGQIADSPPARQSALTVIDELLSGLDLTPELRRALERFRDLDSQLYPMQVVADLHERDDINLTRISPLDAQQGFSRRRLEDKVSGDALFHFGGFLKRSWRANDILWGRLDSLCELLECLFDFSAARKVHQRVRGVTALFAGDLSDIFPSSPAEERAALRAWLNELRTAPPNDEAAFKENQQRFIRAAQLEVLNEELWNVYADAVEQEADWNRRSVEEAWTEFPGFRDRYLAAIGAISERERRQTEVLDYPGGLAAFFEQKYQVGAENFRRAVPDIVQLHLLSKAVLVVRNCVVRALGKRGGVIVMSWPVRLVMLLVRFFYRYFDWRRRAPEGVRALELTLLPAALAVLLVVVLVSIQIGQPLFVSGGGISPLRLLFFVVLPLFLVILTVFRVHGRSPWIVDAAKALLLSAGLFSAVLLSTNWSPSGGSTGGYIGLLLLVSAAGALAGGWLYNQSKYARTTLWGRQRILGELGLEELLVLAVHARVNLGKVIDALRGSVQPPLDKAFLDNADRFTMDNWQKWEGRREGEEFKREVRAALLLERDYHRVSRFSRNRYFAELDEAVVRAQEDRQAKKATSAVLKAGGS